MEQIYRVETDGQGADAMMSNEEGNVKVIRP